MPSTNGHGPKRAILYARVSTDEQARSGYSLAQQLEALREHAAREGLQVLEEVADPGQSGASLERLGMDRVRNLVAEGVVAVVMAQDRDRFAREPAYHYFLRREPSRAAQRFWELSGGLIRCSECGCSLTPSTAIYKGRSYFYYACRKRYHNGGSRDCPNRKSFRAADTESEVWGAVSSALLDPETLARDLQEFIEREKQTRPGDPRDELKTFAEELEKIDRRRDGFLDLAADGLMDREELRAKLAGLEERRDVVRREIDALTAREERLEELERDKEELLEYYAAMAPTSLEELSGEERHRVYQTLRLCVCAHSDGSLEVTGAFGKEICKDEHAPRRGSWRRPG